MFKSLIPDTQHPLVLVDLNRLRKAPINDAVVLLVNKVFDDGFRSFSSKPEQVNEFIHRLCHPDVAHTLNAYVKDISAETDLGKIRNFFKLMANIKYVSDRNISIFKSEFEDSNFDDGTKELYTNTIRVSNMHTQIMSQISIMNPDIFNKHAPNLFFKAWSSNNSPALITEVFKNDSGVWRFLADPFLANDVLGKHKIAHYANVFKHAKIKDSDMFAFWGSSFSFYNKMHGSAKENFATAGGVARMQAFWFKHALRKKINISDILKQDPQISNFILRSAATLYINKTDPMVGNFVNSVVPMLRESIDSGLIGLHNMDTLDISILTHKIREYDLPTIDF